MVEQAATPRLRELDALRGIAALIVVLFHYTWQSVNVHPTAKPIPYGVVWGQYGVELFFAISGFVIFMTLERTRTAADFAVSRFGRLFPAYWTGIFVTTLGVMALGAPELAQSPHITAINLTMVQGFLYLPSVDGVYWSLTVELAFYACMLTLWRLRLLDRIEAVLIAWLLLKLLWWLVPALPSRIEALLAIRYIPLFAIGIAAYRVRIGARTWGQQCLVLVTGLMVVTLTETRTDALVYLATLGVFAALVEGRLKALDRPVLLWLGGISYPLYLVHQNLGYALIARLEQAGVSPWLALAGALAGALALAHAINVLIEQPTLGAIRGWWKDRRIAAGTLPDAPAGL